MRRFVVSVAVAAVVAISGCSSDGSDGGSSGGSGGGAGFADQSPGVPAVASADTARSIRAGLESVRKATSLRLVETMQPERGEKTVIDMRVVPGRGTRSTNVFEGMKLEEIVVGDDVFRRSSDKKPWVKSTVEPAEAAGKGAPWHEQVPGVGQDLYDLVERSEALTTVAPVTIDGVHCFGVRGGAEFTYYFAPGDSGGLRRWVQEQPGARITWDVTELNKPVDLTPPTDVRTPEQE
ncbi:hypothetical protein [Streptomyces sp. SID3343]|uniref:hypothetical protein n=1 Tax=Streptomyces sp. SID3343 TaxID=2690260 RepID=UPI00136D0F14|nr:hypothetical protein [Streptomyces sp. SID3343]MYV97107.1 hypothetical protein [Streptomyces sp. SID3343]